jgi:hypothetical protein
MKTYGETLKDVRAEAYTTARTGWSGRQSRKVARRKRADKKLLHRKARRLANRSVK